MLKDLSAPPDLITVELAWATLSAQLIALASGRSMPVGYSVRNDPIVPLTTVKLIATAVASAGTCAATETVATPPCPSAWIGLAAARGSSTRTGAIGTSTEASLGVPRACAANRPPPPNVMAKAAPAAAHRDRHTSIFIARPAFPDPTMRSLRATRSAVVLSTLGRHPNRRHE